MVLYINIYGFSPSCFIEHFMEFNIGFMVCYISSDYGPSYFTEHFMEFNIGFMLCYVSSDYCPCLHFI